MINPIAKVSLYEEIAKKLKEYIKGEKWMPGEQLPSEMELAKQFNVSRNCIREALKALVLSGIIYSSAGQGTFVSQDAYRRIGNTELLSVLSDKSSLYDLLDTRMALEPQIAALAAQRADETDKQELIEVFEKLKSRILECEEQKISINPTEEGMAFHMCIAKIAKNNILSKFLQSIREELIAQRAMIRLRDSEDFRSMLCDHQRILDAVLKNNSNKAMAAMYLHMHNALDNLVKNEEKDK